MPAYLINLIIISVLLCCRATGQNIDENNIRTPSDIGLKGKVKSIKKRSYFTKVDSGKIVPGKAYLGIHFREDYTLAFNSDGLVIAWTGMDSDKIQETQWNREYHYDSLRRITGLYFGSRLSFIYNYDSLSGKLRSVIHTGNNASLDPPQSKDSFFYNKKGQLIKKIRTDFDSWTETFIRTFRYEYDSKGRIVQESATFTNNNSVSEHTSYIYKNDETFIVYKSSEQQAPEYFQKRDSTGKLMGYHEKFSWEKTFHSKELYTYNEHNDKAREEHYSGGKLVSTIRYRYEYDTNGNWTKMIIFLNDQPHCIHLREITYY